SAPRCGSIVHIVNSGLTTGAAQGALPEGQKQLDATTAYRHRRTLGLVLLIPAAFVTLFSRPLLSEGEWAELLVDAIAWVVFVGGITFRAWATIYVGSRKFKTLVDQGPYSVCRNPLYVGTFLMALGSALFLKSPLF